MAIDYASIAQPDGQENNMGGTKQVIYFAPIRDFLVIQKPLDPPVTVSGVVDITTPHTFKTGKCFKELYCTLDKGTVDFEHQGDRDGRSFKQKAKIFLPGAKSEAIGLASLIKNDKLIVIVPLADGTMIQIGSADFYAEMLAKFMSATNSGGARGHEFDIESMAPVNYVYKSTVNLVPAP